MFFGFVMYLRGFYVIPTRVASEFGEAECRSSTLGGCGHAFPINGHAFHFQVLGLRLRFVKT